MDRFNLFGTPVATFVFDDTDELNRELTSRLLAEAAASPGIQRSNHGGWHSTPDLSLRRDDCYQQLMQRVVHHVYLAFHELAEAQGVAVVGEYTTGLQSWAMVMNDGDYASIHDHAPAHWSVVYYVDAGDADLAAHPKSGMFTLVDPRRATAAIAGVDLFPSHFSIQPVTSMLVVFPGSVQHFVHPYRGRRPRISVSCNARLEQARIGGT